MNCPFCNEQNPEGAVFCKRCGQKLDQTIVCPACNQTCTAGDTRCPSCGAEITPPAVPAPAVNANTKARNPLTKEERREKTKKALDLTSGIFMIAAVFFSLIFVFFIGTRQRISGEAGYSETYTIWHYFGRAYSLLVEACAGKSYSGFVLTAQFLPVVLSTVVAVVTLACVIAFSLISIVKFGLHFKTPSIRYYKFAVAAVFTFLLGATFFDCLHTFSMNRDYGSLSGATVAGMTLTSLAIIASLILKTAAMGTEFKSKQNIANCILALLGIFMLAIVVGTAGSEQIKYTVVDWYNTNYSVGFYKLNTALSLKYNGANPADFVVTYVLSILAEAVQIALLVLSFVVLIKLIVNFSEKRSSYPIGTAIALVIIAAAYLTLSIVITEFANSLTGSTGMTELRLAAAPVMPFVFSVFFLAISITHKALAKKSPETEKEEIEDKTI